MDKKAAGIGEDPFRVLPDGVLEHILSFLPEDDALQTCVLDTQWRDLWRRTTSLRFVYGDWSSNDDDSSISNSERFCQLAKLIIHLRGHSPLTDCEINPCLDEDCYNFRQTKLLIQYVLKCGVEKLSVWAGDYEDEPLQLSKRLVSPHLRIIKFDRVTMVDSSLDFSDCPPLEKLTMEDCSIYGSIYSKSLKYLRFIGSCVFSQVDRIHIHAPRLISNWLLLEENVIDGGLTPSLGMMPLLKRAYVRLGYSCHDSSKSNRDNVCLLLDGLSNAVDLELSSIPEVLIYRWDLKWCPKFDKLKILVLNDWFTATDLVCLLKHSPILEELTLELKSRQLQKFVGATGSKQSLECAPHLAVTIECRKDDKRVDKILKALSECGILRKQISINHT